MTELIQNFINERISIYDFSKKYNIEQDKLIELLKESGFLYAKPRTKSSLIIDLKFASDEYLENDMIQAQEICKKYKISHDTFSKYMKNYLGIVIKPRPKSNFNETYFDEIDTEEKAYILGFYWADGTISSSPIDDSKKKNVYTIELSIQGKDIALLEFIKKEFNTPRPILVGEVVTPKGNISNRCRLLVNSKHMWNVLNNYGCTPRKSLTELFPDKSIFKDPSLIRHFIRGYFDGDGCVTYVNKEHTRVGIQILGTKEFLTEMLKYFPKESNNLSIYHNHGNESEVIRYIHTTDNKAKSILKYMYNDSKLYLQRKYDRYQALCCSDASNAESKNGEG